ncbi:hypothetical protein KQX54_020768 [Cotesia glomerata]|uniref:Uncharacterized protein n=1 Tax=Cotesia glomerata TaxID=32391 RepID=A0AAV7I3H3_COTGL|nr:hypothetical protein KQX54_020768 [Cotesia glomerata]
MEFPGIYWDRKIGTFQVKSCHVIRHWTLDNGTCCIRGCRRVETEIEKEKQEEDDGNNWSGATSLGFFTYYTVAMGEVNPSGPVPIDSVFIYRPDKRLELWRFAFYMFLHAGKEDENEDGKDEYEDEGESGEERRDDG